MSPRPRKREETWHVIIKTIGSEIYYLKRVEQEGEDRTTTYAKDAAEAMPFRDREAAIDFMYAAGLAAGYKDLPPAIHRQRIGEHTRRGDIGTEEIPRKAMPKSAEAEAGKAAEARIMRKQRAVWTGISTEYGHTGGNWATVIRGRR